MSAFRPYEATINSNAGGVWSAEERTPVRVVAHATNGRAVRVRMPADAALEKKRGRLCWIPRSWIDAEQAPRVCRVCGQTLPKEDS